MTRNEAAAIAEIVSKLENKNELFEGLKEHYPSFDWEALQLEKGVLNGKRQFAETYSHG